MCLVLFVIALMLGLTLPSIQSTFVEQAVRNDATQLSLLVKTAMLQSNDQHRPYVLDFKGQSMTLHPAADAAKSTSDDDSKAPEDEVVSSSLNGSNKLFLPDPDKPKGWLHVKSDSWFFKPGELCPAPRVRLVRGNAWLEMSFNALTGNVENETAYFP
jgi:hypothetical protein